MSPALFSVVLPLLAVSISDRLYKHPTGRETLSVRAYLAVILSDKAVLKSNALWAWIFLAVAGKQSG